MPQSPGVPVALKKKTQKLAMHAGGGTNDCGEKRNVLIVSILYRTRLGDLKNKQPTECVYYCRTYYKAVRGGGRRRVDDMCYDRRRAEACVDESARHALANAGGREIVGKKEGEKKGSARGNVYWGHASKSCYRRLRCMGKRIGI